MSDLPDIIANFEKLRRLGGNKWMARCPHHDDRNPSLSITRTEDRWLLHCFAGCATEDILATVNLAWKDICPNQPELTAATMQKRKLLAVDEHDVALNVLKIARNALARGEKLSFEDLVILNLAMERIGGDHV